jgi:hypothetical protein
MEFTDTEQAIRDVFRQYMTNVLEPRTEAFESGEESIFPFMRKMITDLGLEAAMGQGDNDGDQRGLLRRCPNPCREHLGWRQP